MFGLKVGLGSEKVEVKCTSGWWRMYTNQMYFVHSPDRECLDLWMDHHSHCSWPLIMLAGFMGVQQHHSLASFGLNDMHRFHTGWAKFMSPKMWGCIHWLGYKYATWYSYAHSWTSPGDQAMCSNPCTCSQFAQIFQHGLELVTRAEIEPVSQFCSGQKMRTAKELSFLQ